MANYALDVTDKVAVVTGSSGQLGTELCRALSNLGSTVVEIDIRTGVDITDPQAVGDALTDAARKYGRLDILVNNAGVATFEPFEERSEESFDRVMNVNLKGTFFCIQTFVKLARQLKFTGCIVNIGSVYGVLSPDRRIYTDCNRNSSEVYGAAKAGVIQMTRYFATHLASEGIRVNCVSPGGIANPDVGQGVDFVRNYSLRTPMGRLAHAEEIVGAVLFLSSSMASYVTGQNLVVDGGLSCW